ncbi:hypothetical protein B484DRAFT_459246 [Ochromonadaceae sp. CCMP2298]|nr:hypothetical protein B484DRAFT_459246 [Ochromonadaceae sp. CCMP2298]
MSKAEGKKIDLGAYGSVDTEAATQFATKAGQMALANARIQLQNLKKYAEDGEWTWKMAGLLAGLLIMATSAFSLLSNFFSLSPFSALLDVYLFAFGAVSCILEYKENLLPPNLLQLLKREALFLYRPYGRAAFYVFVGLLFAAHGGLLGFITGLYTVLVGAVIYYSSRKAVAALNDLKGSLKDAKAASAAFYMFDKDQSGFLEMRDVAQLCQSIGSILTLNELESAVFVMDVDSDGKVSHEEFMVWWGGKEDDLSFQ